MLSQHFLSVLLTTWFLAIALAVLRPTLRKTPSGSAVNSGMSRGAFGVVTAIGLVMTASQARGQEPKPAAPPFGISQDLEVPNLQNLPHTWIQGDPPTKPIETVDDVIDLALHRHLKISESWDAIVKKRDELRLELMPKSSLVFKNDIAHAGPTATAGSSGVAFGLADFFLNGAFQRDNSPNRVDSFSESPRLSQRLLDIFMGGVQIHPKSEQAVYQANRLKVLMAFRAEYGMEVEIAAGQVAHAMIDIFFQIADLDIQIYYKNLEIKNLQRAVDFYTAEEDSGANHGFLPGAQHSKSVAEQQLRDFQDQRKQAEIKFYGQFSERDKEALMKAGGIKPRWSPEAVELPTKPILISNEQFWEHLVKFYELDRRPKNPAPAAKPAGSKRRKTSQALPLQSSLIPLNWENVAMMLEQKGDSARAAKVRELAALKPNGLNFADPRIRELYYQITYPIPADRPGDVPTSLSPPSDEQIMGEATRSADTSKPEHSPVQRYLVAKNDLAISVAKLYDAREHNLTQVTISALAVLASIFNVRIQPALVIKIGTKDEKRALSQLRTINNSDQELIRDGIEKDEQSEKGEWESRELTVATKRNDIAKKWNAIGTQIGLLERELNRDRDAEPELNAQVENVQREVQVIEQAHLAAVRARVGLALQSGLRKRIIFDLAGLAQRAANIDYKKEQARQIADHAAQEAARTKRHERLKTVLGRQLQGIGILAAIQGLMKLDKWSGFNDHQANSALLEPFHDIHSVLLWIWHMLSTAVGWLAHPVAVVHNGLSHVLIPLSNWLLYSPFGPAVGILILSVGAAYGWSRFFKVELPKPLRWVYTFLTGLLMAATMPLEGPQQFAIAIAVGIVLQAFVPWRKYRDGTPGAEFVTLGQLSRRTAMKGVIFSGILFAMEFIARWFDPRLKKQRQKLRDAGKKLSVESGQIGLRETEFLNSYTPPKGVTGRVKKIQWPDPIEKSLALIKKNQPIVFWTASQEVRAEAAKMGLSLPGPPSDAVIVIERTDSPFDRKLLDLVRDYETREKALVAFRRRNDGNKNQSWQERYEEAYLAIIRSQAQTVIEEANELNWMASQPVRFDSDRVIHPDNLDVSEDTKLPLFSNTYQRLKFTFTKEQAFYLSTFWSDPDVYIRLSNGQKIHLNRIVGIEEDTQYSSVQSKMLDPYFIHLFADLDPRDAVNQSIFINIPKIGSLTFDGFFTDTPGRDLTKEIPQLGTNSLIGFITTKYDDPVESRSDPYQVALKREAAVLTHGADILANILNHEAKTHEGGLGRSDMNTGASTSIRERQARESEPEHLKTQASEIAQSARRLATEGIDFSMLAGRVAATVDGKRIYAVRPGDWLNSSFLTPADFQHNRFHSEWRRMDRARPLFDVHLLMPAAQAMSDGDKVQVILPRGLHQLAGTARIASHEPQDPNVPQPIEVLELPFSQSDFVSQFPEGVSPHTGLVVVQKIKSAPPAQGKQEKTPGLSRRSFFVPSSFGGKATMTFILLTSLATLAFGQSGNQPVSHDNLLVSLFALIIEAGLIFSVVEVIAAVKEHVPALISRKSNGIQSAATEEPHSREFREAPELDWEPIVFEVPETHTRLTDEGEKYLSENLMKLLPNEVHMSWTSDGRAWMQNKSLTWVQKLLWPLGFLGKKSFVVRRHRLLYANYARYNVGLWQCWLLWHREVWREKKSWFAQNKVVHTTTMISLYLGVFLFLYWGFPYLLVYLNFSIEGSTPLVSWLMPLANPFVLDPVRLLIDSLVACVLWALLKAPGESIPIVFWAIIYGTLGLLSMGMAYDFKKKTNVELKKALREVNADPLNVNEPPSSAESNTLIHHLGDLAEELQWGLLRVLPQCSADVQQEVAESFYEYDRHVRHQQWASRLENIALDLSPDDYTESNGQPVDAAAILTQRSAHARNVIQMLSDNRHARGVLFAMIAGDITDLALEGLHDPNRENSLKPLIDVITERTRSWIQGLYDLYGENYRHHQIFRNIHIINDKITDPRTPRDERSGLEDKFLRLTSGDSQFQALVKEAFRVPRRIGALLTRTVSFVVVRTWSRWVKSDVEPIDSAVGMLHLTREAEPRMRSYFNDEFLRGKDGRAQTNTARLLMAQRHGDELAETLMEFGIPLFPKPRRRQLYYGTALFANLREAVRLLHTLTWLNRSRVNAHSSSVRTDGIVDQLLDRIPPRLPFLSTLCMRPLYSDQWAPDTKTEHGHEPVVVFSYEQADLDRNLAWRGSLRVMSSAPQLATLGLLHMGVLWEKRWLRASIENRIIEYAANPAKLERLEWLKANLFDIGSYLESLGIGWSYNTHMPGNFNEMKVKRPPPDNPDDIGRWDGMHLFGPDVVPDVVMESRKSPPRRGLLWALDKAA